MAHKCTCPQTICQCLAILIPDILCIIRVSNHIPTLLFPSHTKTIQFIEFTYYHDRFPEQTITQKHAKYDPLINAIQNKGWKMKPLITITTWVRGAIYEKSIKILDDLEIPKSSIKNLHQNAIKFLTYLVLNKRKLDNKQTPLHPP